MSDRTIELDTTKPVFRKTNLEELPDGRYKAEWHGYGITVKINQMEYEIPTIEGLGGWADCELVIQDKKATAHII